jgi:hypothetical protein
MDAEDEAVFRPACEMGFEGIISKRLMNAVHTRRRAALAAMNYQRPTIHLAPRSQGPTGSRSAKKMVIATCASRSPALRMQAVSWEIKAHSLKALSEGM